MSDSSTPPSATGSGDPGHHPAIDQWVASNPWHPRLLPYVVYVGLILVVVTGKGWHPLLYPVLYAVQCALVGYLIWRYRRLMPELTLRFHWLALVVGVAMAVVWVYLGQMVTHWERLRELGLATFTQELWQWTWQPTDTQRWSTPDNAEHYFATMPEAIRWPALGLRLLGMSIIVSLCEEIFMRSLLLRSFRSLRQTGIGCLQVLQDLPMIGDWIMHTQLARRANRHEYAFGAQFVHTSLGQMTAFSVVFTSLLWMFAHAPRDYAATFVCGVAYCLLLRATHKHGLGPVIWAHGITNALLWGYTLHTGDWQFL